MWPLGLRLVVKLIGLAVYSYSLHLCGGSLTQSVNLSNSLCVAHRTPTYSYHAKQIPTNYYLFIDEYSRVLRVDVLHVPAAAVLSLSHPG